MPPTKGDRILLRLRAVRRELEEILRELQLAESKTTEGDKHV